MKLQQVLEMFVGMNWNRGGSFPGPGYAAPGFRAQYTPQGPEDSIKQAYRDFGKQEPTSAQKLGMKRQCPHCNATVPNKARKCPKCKKDLEQVQGPPGPDITGGA